MYVRLILDSGKQKGREMSLARGIYLVGRSRICQIRPKNRYVSRKHCAIIHRKCEVLIQDLGSRTGTYINRVRIDPKAVTVLNDGDRIRVGKSKFRIAIISSPIVHVSATDPESSEASDEELAIACDESSDAYEIAAPVHEAAENLPQNIDDVLRMLEAEDEEDDDAELPSYLLARPALQLTSKASDTDFEDDDSDGSVVFATHHSSRSIRIEDALPSYASRKDWDVKSVYSWIEKKETFARLDERRAKRNAKERSQSASECEVNVDATVGIEEQYTPQQREAQSRAAASKATVVSQQTTWIEWFDSDTVRPAVLIAVGVAFVAWMAWNAWLLISFKG